MSKTPLKCSECGKKAIETTVIAEYRATLKQDGQAYEVVVPQLQVEQCRECEEITLDQEAGRRLDDGLRQAAGLMLPHAIVAGRERLGLGQKHLAERLGISEITLSRWESGLQFQQREMDLLLRSYFGGSAR